MDCLPAYLFSLHTHLHHVLSQPDLQTEGLLQTVAPLVAEIGRDLVSLISDPDLRERLGASFGPADSGPRDLAERLEQAMADSPVQLETGPASDQARVLSSAVSSGLVPKALTVLLQLLEWLGGLVVEYGAPARKEASAALLGRMRLEISTSLSNAVGSAQPVSLPAAPPPSPLDVFSLPDGYSLPNQRGEAGHLAQSLARAMRLLQLLLRQVKLDAANARLQALMLSLKGGSTGIKYVRDKFLALHRLVCDAGTEITAAATSSEAAISMDSSLLTSPRLSTPLRVAASLPKTLSWLKNAAAAVSSMRSYCSGALGGIDLDAALASASTAAGGRSQLPGGSSALIPSELRSGRGNSSRVSSSSVVSSTAAIRPRLPIPSLDCPEALVRAGLVALISGGTQAVGPTLPEALVLDAGKL